MKRFILPVLLLVCAASAAHAADPTAVQVPVGDWVSTIGGIILDVAGAVVAAVIAILPKAIQPYFKTQQAEQLLQQAIDYGVNAVEGATKGQVLSVSVANPVLRQALDYAVTHGPDGLIKWLGGRSGIEEKIISRLNVEPAASVVPGGQKTFVKTDMSPPKAVVPAAPAAKSPVPGAPSAPATESVS
jgi:hypothetical protein